MSSTSAPGAARKSLAVASTNSPAQATISACSSRRLLRHARSASLTRVERRVELQQRRERLARRGRLERARRRRRPAAPSARRPGRASSRGRCRRMSPAGSSPPSTGAFAFRARLGQHLEVLERGPRGAGDAEALALVHAAAVGGDLAERRAQERVVAADVQREEAVQLVARLDAPGRPVPEEPARLPRLDAAGELLGVELRVGRGPERLLRQHRRGGVVAVRVRRLGREAGDDHVGPEAADHRHHVGEHRRPCPRSSASPRGSSRSRSRARG